MSRSKNRGISVTSREKKEKLSIRSISISSKLKLMPSNNPSTCKLSARQPSTKQHPERHIRTVASANDSMNFSKRLETENSPYVRRHGTISSVFFENKILEQRLNNMNSNKENKPSINLLRKNRFR